MAHRDNEDSSLLTELDWRSQEILKTLYENGKRSTTTDIKNRSRIADTDAITYRFRRAANALEPNGLIDVHEPELTAGQRNKPLEATLTKKGKELAERVIERDGKSSDIDERLERIEATLEALDPIDGPSSGRELDDADINARLEAIEQRLDELEDTGFGAWSTENQQKHQVMMAGERAVRDFLLEEYGESFKQYIDDRLEKYINDQKNNNS